INTITFATINASACSFYILNGTTYTASGTYNQTLTNSAGCDSVLTLNLIINTITFETINASACSFYTLNGTTYTTSGTYTQTLTNSAGCDSVLTLNLIINTITFATINASACSFYILNGTTYTASGTYNQTLTNSAGCDSVLTLNLIINNSVSTSQNITLCAGQTTTVGANTYTTSGTYVDVFPTSGCDSTVTTNLTVNPVLKTTTVTGDSITATVAGATYQWIDCSTNAALSNDTNQSYVATATGSYAVVVTLNGCTDTSACVSIIITNTKAINTAAVISAYPNPNNGTFSITTATYGTYTIVNELGQVVGTFTTNANETTAHIAGLVSGVYVIKNTQNGTIARTKIVVTQ
ncbi:MAG: T9SS type A sorting domain-containing protein, partial [Bacteroidia bacterium]